MLLIYLQDRRGEIVGWTLLQYYSRLAVAYLFYAGMVAGLWAITKRLCA